MIGKADGQTCRRKCRRDRAGRGTYPPPRGLGSSRTIHRRHRTRDGAGMCDCNGGMRLHFAHLGAWPLGGFGRPKATQANTSESKGESLRSLGAVAGASLSIITQGARCAVGCRFCRLFRRSVRRLSRPCFRSAPLLPLHPPLKGGYGVASTGSGNEARRPCRLRS